jgi:glycosyltransferase involved in cell wall biosynthesis
VSALTLAANNGSIGGGEVMLLQMAQAAHELGVPVTVVAPQHPGVLASAAKRAGFPTVVIPGATRAAYARGLRRWDRQRTGLLWCNGLLPALATSAHTGRVVHLHQSPLGFHGAIARVAAWRAVRVVVPSIYMATQVKGATIMPNWTADIEPVPVPSVSSERRPRRVGYLGRLSQDKGVHILAAAVAQLHQKSAVALDLVVGGDYRFVPDKQRSEVEDALSRLGSAVIELGWVTPQEFLSRVDVVVCPSIWPESFGLVVAEAMAARVPVVVSDAGALSEIVGEGHPWVAAAGDPDSLARAIDSALRADRGLATQRGRDRWQNDYSPDAGAARFAAVLADLGVTGTDWT